MSERKNSLLRLDGLTITKRLVTIPVVFILSVAVTIVAAVYSMNSSLELSSAINIAGRQRMLNQRHFQELLRVCAGQEANIEATRDLMRASRNALADGGHVVGLPDGEILRASKNSIVQESLKKQKAMLDRVFEASDKYLDSSRNGTALMRNLMTWLSWFTKRTSRPTVLLKQFPPLTESSSRGHNFNCCSLRSALSWSASSGAAMLSNKQLRH
jgi:hypothetical protein